MYGCACQRLLLSFQCYRQSRSYFGCGMRTRAITDPLGGSEIGASASASRISPTEVDVGTVCLLAWRDYVRRYDSECGDAGVHPGFVFPREAPGGKAVANFAWPSGEPAPDEERDTDQQCAQEHRVPGMALPAEIRLIGDQGENGDDSAHCDDESVFPAQAAREHDGRQAPGQHPGGPVERP